MTVAAEWPMPWQLIGWKKSSKASSGMSTVAIRSKVDVWEDRSIPPWIDPLIERFKRVLALEVGWGGTKTVPITSSALESALKVLEETMAFDTIAPAVVPVADGGLQLEWHCAGVDLEVYVDADGSISAWCREGSREWEEDFYPRARLRKELSLLTNKFCSS
jgi:hypothetical protein